MASIDAVGSVSLEPRHLPGALVLSAEAGWNQIASDWLLMIKHGHAIGFENGKDGALVASALALPVGASLAWISMVLVTANCRRRGLASRLVSDCLAWLGQRGSAAVLDATPAGVEVYRPLGFETVRCITRWQHPGQAAVVAVPQEELRSDDIGWIAPLDKAVSGTERSFVLADLLDRPKAVALGLRSRDGFALSREGRVATLIGPLTAPTGEAAIALLDGMLSLIVGPVFIDAYDDQTVFSAHLEQLGFRRQRSFERMVCGTSDAFGDTARSFAVAGPELGLRGEAMARIWNDIPASVLNLLRQGAVIPAHPLALDERRRFDPRRMSALTRYYVDAGSGGLAVGVHTTQFAIREVGLYEPVLKLAVDTAAAWTTRPMIRIGGLAGRTDQACREAAVARDLDYHTGLLSLAAMKGASEDELIEHCASVAKEIPLVGFYLQPSVGGIRLSFDFWRRFAAIENVVAIKMAPFNRYATLDVVRGVVAARAEDRITLYTGNDDHIVADLVTPYRLLRDGKPVTVRIRGGLLGHWSVWVRAAVQLLARCQAEAAAQSVSADLLALDAQVTDCNAALFDVAHAFHGCIAGCHEVLRRQGLLKGIWCLDPDEGLSPGQAEELTRVAQSYPHLTDDAFVAANLERWLSGDSKLSLKGLAA